MPTSVLVPLAAVLVAAFVGFAYVMYSTRRLRRLSVVATADEQQELFDLMDALKASLERKERAHVAASGGHRQLAKVGK